jgi:hypothetical protein
VFLLYIFNFIGLLRNLPLFKGKEKSIVLDIIYTTTLKDSIIKSIPIKCPSIKDLILKEPILLNKKRRLNPKFIITFLNIYKVNAGSIDSSLLLRPIKREYT